MIAEYSLNAFRRLLGAPETDTSLRFLYRKTTDNVSSYLN
jgi:hypothetical protein